MDNVTEHPETPKPDSRSNVLRDVPDAVKQALNARQFKTTECGGDDGTAGRVDGTEPAGGGDGRTRTDNLLSARQVLYQNELHPHSNSHVRRYGHSGT